MMAKFEGPVNFLFGPLVAEEEHQTTSSYIRPIQGEKNNRARVKDKRKGLTPYPAKESVHHTFTLAILSRSKWARILKRSMHGTRE